MTEAAISTLKDHLPEMVHLAEQGEDIQITRHGKAVAVLISLERYQQAFPTQNGISSAWRRWRSKYAQAEGFNERDEEAIYQHSRAVQDERPSVWD